MKALLVTESANWWAYYTAQACLERSWEVAILNQRSRGKRPAWLNARFVRRRGVATFLDLALELGIGYARTAGDRLRRMLRGLSGPLASRTDQSLGDGLSPSVGATFDQRHPAGFLEVLVSLRRMLSAGHPRLQWHDVDSVNADDALAILSAERPDVVLLCGAPIVGKRFIARAGFVLNPHCGIAPHYRGSSPAHWAVYRKDWDRIGYTIHRVTPVVDGGAVVVQERVSLQPGWSLNDLDWALVYSMYEALVSLLASPDWRERVERAESQAAGGVNWPPMGFVRGLVAQRRLASHLREVHVTGDIFNRAADGAA